MTAQQLNLMPKHDQYGYHSNDTRLAFHADNKILPGRLHSIEYVLRETYVTQTECIPSNQFINPIG